MHKHTFSKAKELLLVHSFVKIFHTNAALGRH